MCFRDLVDEVYGKEAEAIVESVTSKDSPLAIYVVHLDRGCGKTDMLDPLIGVLIEEKGPRPMIFDGRFHQDYHKAKNKQIMRKEIGEDFEVIICEEIEETPISFINDALADNKKLVLVIGQEGRTSEQFKAYLLKQGVKVSQEHMRTMNIKKVLDREVLQKYSQAYGYFPQANQALLRLLPDDLIRLMNFELFYRVMAFTEYHAGQDIKKTYPQYQNTERYEAISNALTTGEISLSQGELEKLLRNGVANFLGDVNTFMYLKRAAYCYHEPNEEVVAQKVKPLIEALTAVARVPEEENLKSSS